MPTTDACPLKSNPMRDVVVPVKPFLRYAVCCFMLAMMAACSSNATQIRPTVTATYPPSSTPTTVSTPTVTPLPQSTPTKIINVCSPLAGHPIEDLPKIVSEPFKTPRPNRDDGHHGLDLGYWSWNGTSIIGMPIDAIIDGRIAAVINNRSPYGNALMTETVFERIPQYLHTRISIPEDKSLYLVYAHMENPPDYHIGQEITCGQALGTVGLSGLTSGPHLHIEVRWGPAGTTFDSMAYYTTDATPEEMAAYQSWRMSDTFYLFDPFLLLTLPEP
jgi:murein DD-endopeptidase MepM/ murein hydrolase activator NlpD